MGHILMQLCSSGNIFFRDLFALVICNHANEPCINLYFPSFGKHIVYHGHVTEELQKVCRTLEACLEDWHSFMSELRSQFYALNYYTSEQVLYLCHWINKICEKGMPVPQQIWYLLTPLNPKSTVSDIRLAFAKAKKTLQSEAQKYFSADSKSDTKEEEHLDKEGRDKLEDSNNESGSEEDLINFSDPSTQSHKCKITNPVIETLEHLWNDYRNNMPKYLTQYMDVKSLAQFLSCFSAMNKVTIIRELPSILQNGKPNLVLCPATELIISTLALYLKSPEQPFPSIDEVLLCQEDTSEEEVEIFLRRCLGQDPGRHQKIFTLVNPGLLTYDVSVALAERFESMERSAGSNFRMVIVCPVNQDRYIQSFFSNYKVQAGLNVLSESAKQYLRLHLTTPYIQGHQRQVFPDSISSWLITSRRAAVGGYLSI